MTAGRSFHTIKEHGNAATQIALQLHAVGPVSAAPEDQRHDPMGTATLIAPHLAITCKHVIEDYLRAFHLRADATEANFLLTATMILADGRTAFDMRVEATTMSPHTDIAFLHLGSLPVPVPFEQWCLPIISLFPPRVGSTVTAVGYYGATVDVDHTAKTIRVGREVAFSSGEVVCVHEERRDSSHLNFPCFQTDARFDGGMSGGPVFDDAGQLCGLVSSNLPPSHPDEPHVSYVATLWPMAGTEITFGRVGSASSAPVLQLMVDGIMLTRGHEWLRLQRSSEGHLAVLAVGGGARWIAP